MVTQPANGPELHAVSFLVQAHPKAEVVGFYMHRPLGLDDVGGYEQQPRALCLGGQQLVLP